MAEWKDTCNLPRTAFSMKANLQTAEPETVARWDAMDLYGQIRTARAGAPTYLLHDGPPYANGEIHIGTALNKILKDFVVKSHNMLGFDAPYLPGWDCHGLPIELKVDRELGPKKREMSVADFRRECRKYAEKYVGIQREGFKRLGVIGKWDDPYLTMAFRYQAAIVRALGAFVAQGHGLQGQEAGALVHALPHGAGRSGSRIRAARLALDLRRVPAERGQPAPTRPRACRRWPGVRCRCSSGRRRRGPSRRTWRSRSIRTSNTAPTTSTARPSSSRRISPRRWPRRPAARSTRCSPPSPARRWSAWCSGIRSTRATRWRCSATT